MPGPKPQGDRALTSAERMRRLREKRKAEAAGKPPVVIRYRRPKDRRSRADQWSAAIDTLTDCSTDIRSGATSLTNYRLPICRVDLDGTERLPLATAVAARKQHGATLDKSGLTILPGHGSVCGMMAPWTA
jgi:hypothetical protein